MSVFRKERGPPGCLPPRRSAVPLPPPFSTRLPSAGGGWGARLFAFSSGRSESALCEFLVRDVQSRIQTTSNHFKFQIHIIQISNKRYSIDYHYVRNWLYVMRHMGPER